MDITEQIIDEIKMLSEEESGWNAVSLAGALTGMEADVFPEYGENDLALSA